MNGCVYRTKDNMCEFYSDDVKGIVSYCDDESCIDKHPSNADRIRAMTDEELAEYLFDRGNCSEYCYGICAYQDECDGDSHTQEFCIEQIVKWLKQEAEEDAID